jgi:hypothetical protein
MTSDGIQLLRQAIRSSRCESYKGKIKKSIKSPIISKFKLIEKDEFNRLINILALPSRVGSSSFLTSEANT